MIYKAGCYCPICNTEMVQYEPPGEPNPSSLKVRCRECKKIFIICGDKKGLKFVEKGEIK